MIAWLILFASSAAWVFVMGFQSRNINTGNYPLAALSSFGIGFLQVYVLSKVLMASTLLHTLVYCSGGSVGVVLAMWVHHRFIQKS